MCGNLVVLCMYVHLRISSYLNFDKYFLDYGFSYSKNFVVYLEELNFSLVGGISKSKGNISTFLSAIGSSEAGICITFKVYMFDYVNNIYLSPKHWPTLRLL